MNVDEATDVIYEQSHKQGEPLTRDVATVIAKQLFASPPSPDLRPGDVAQHFRERYVE